MRDRLLFVCTANTGRSALAEGLLRRRLALRDLERDVIVGSAGVLAHDEPVSGLVAAVAAQHGADLSRHRSRPLTPPLVKAADLVLVMAEEHLRAVRATGFAPDRAFLLRPFLRGLRRTGGREAQESLAHYLQRVAGALDLTDHEEIADPYGQPVEVLDRTAASLARCCAELVAHVWPTHAGPPARAAEHPPTLTARRPPGDAATPR